MTLTGYFALNSVFAPVLLADTMQLWKIIADCMKTNEDRHILPSVQIFSMNSAFWQCKICADIRIFGCVLYIGDIKGRWGRVSCTCSEVAW